MATVKTLSAVTGIGIKCFQTRFCTDIINRSIPLTHSIPVRHARFKASRLVDERQQYASYEVSRNPEEWKHVANLLPNRLIKDPKPKSEYPSGWKPQNPPANAPYFISRTVNHMLPVYMTRRGVRGQQVLTLVRYVQGDIWALEAEIMAMLKKVYPKEVPKMRSQVNEVAGVLKLRGDYASACREYLLSKGW